MFVSEQDKYLIFDIQGGYEDILGLVVGLKLAHKHNRVVLGITCVAGRRSLEESALDALLAQQIAGTKVPVYKGSAQSMLLRKEYPNCINFSNKFEKLADIPRDETLKELIQKQHASSFIHSSIKKYNHQLSFISFGPLTNLALAFHLTQCTGQQYQLSTIRVNGGSYDGVGNVVGSPSVEGNFGFDPQAAHIVITNYRNIYVNPIERTLTTDLRRQLQTITQNTTENSPKILIDLVHQLLKHEYCTNGPLLNVLGLFDKLITDKVINVYSQIIRTGYELAGMMVPNWLRLEVGENQQVPNTKIYRDVNRAVLCRLLKEAFSE